MSLLGIASDSPPNDETTDDSDTTENTETQTGRFRPSRRQLLLGTGLTVGTAAAGGLYVIRELDGDFGDYSAPASQPVVSTRGLFDSTETTEVDETDETADPTISGSWEFDGADELFVFVHGFDTDATGARDQAYSAEVGLDSLRPAPVVAYSWDADTDWDIAKETADANATVLANWLTEWAAEDGRPIHLIGYSLGGRLVCEALTILADTTQSDVIASVSLLGAAIPATSVHQTERYGNAIDERSTPVSNFHSRNDRVLSWVYRFSDRTRAVGHGGISDPDERPAGYRDVDVTTEVADHYSYFQPDEGCLPDLVESLPTR